MTPLPRRLVTICIGTALALAGGGAIWEWIHFGTNAGATATRLEREVTRRFANQTRRVEALARSAANEAAQVVAAQSSPDAVPPLFSRLLDLSSPVGLAGTSATIYTPAADGYRVLAWSDGPAEDLTPDRLDGAAAIFVAPGAAGLRLVAVHPIEQAGVRLAVAAAERVLAPPLAQSVTRSPGGCLGQLETSYGPVTAVGPCGGAGAAPAGSETFVIRAASGEPLLEVRFDPDELAARRDRFRRRMAAAASVPLVVLILFATAPMILRRHLSRSIGDWLLWTGATAAVIVIGSVVATGLALLADVPAIIAVVTGLTAVALTALVAGGWWWRPVRRRPASGSRARFVLEQLAGGAALVAALEGLSRLVEGRLRGESAAVWQFPLFPFDASALAHLVGIILAQIAVCWTVAVVLSVLADRWRLGRRGPAPVVAALVLWLLPTLVVLALRATEGWPESGPWIVAAGTLSAFGALAYPLRRWYRHTTQATRLMLLFAALAAPPLINYPLTASAADQAARRLIETEFAPAMLRQPQAVQEALLRAREEIDAITQLGALIAAAPAGDSGSAYAVWSRTSLATARLTSEIELFDTERRLISRFALNVPEYPYGEIAPVWSGSGCAWDVFGEVARSGAVERVMLHAERGICDPEGRLLGAVVVHVLPDFATLPFMAAGPPYAQALRDASVGTTDAPVARLAGLQVAVYGWNHDPQFTSGRVAWPITPPLADRLYASRAPFWAALTVGDESYAVHFVNDRRGIYALGYPDPTFLEHATRFSEIAAIAGALLVALLAGATAYAPVVRMHPAPLPILLHEIRTSFYRKLFLFFVLSAVGPVILLALAFGAYTATRIRADVESEAAAAVMTTRRLFEEFTAVDPRPDQPRAATHDALLVLIRQMTAQDANLYVGPRLVATSQRDLFDSGLLPTRTPARVYREIALNRLPTYVGADRIGTFNYLLAAAPVPAEGRDAVISVPLGTRQQEIEHELDELNRRVLVGALVVVLFAAGLGASVAGRVSDPVARLSRAARQIAAGRLDVRIVADTADELRRLVDDFNVMTGTLVRQRDELGRTHQLKAWAQMARQVAHEIKNPLTPIQLAAEHLQRVHEDRARPMGPVFDQCVTTILGQVRLLRRIASDFSNFAAEPTPRFERAAVGGLLDDVTAPYRLSLGPGIRIAVDASAHLPAVRIDRTLVSRAITNLVENAIQAMPDGGSIVIRAVEDGDMVAVSVADTGVGMDGDAATRAFEPYFSTKTGGSGLGLPNARRYVELSGGRMDLSSEPGRGTTITMWLPVAPDGPASGQGPTR